MSAVGFDGGAFLADGGGGVVRGVGVFAALGVDVGLYALKHLDRGGPAVDRDVVHAAQRREHLGPLGLGKRGAARAFVDKTVGGDGDDQHSPKPAGGVEVADVADVQEVEAAVTQHDPPPGDAVVADGVGQSIEIEGGGGAGHGWHHKSV